MRILENPERLASIQTRRSLVPPPQNRTDPKWEQSWRYLFDRYAPAMRCYVAAILAPGGARASATDEAEEVVQAFLLKCLEKDWLTRSAEEIRCFRAYLQTQLRRFTYGHLEYKNRKKRKAPPSSSAETKELAAPATDAGVADLDESWVQIAVQQSLETLRTGNSTYHRIIEDLLATDGEGSEELPRQLGRTAREVSYLKHRARRRFAVLFADELRSTVASDAAFKDLIERLHPYIP